MSVKSNFTKTTSSSSLSGSIKQRLNEAKDTAKVKFQLPITKQIPTILQDFSNNKNVSEYQDLIVLIRDSEMYDDEVQSLLKETSKCISLLNLELRLFVEAILILKWANRCNDVINEYQSFVVNLLSAHNYHTKFAIDTLIISFMQNQNEPDWQDGVPCEKDCKIFLNIHYLINIILNIIPLSNEILLQSINSHFPYLKKSTHCHEIYLHNLIWILEYKPEFRAELLQLIFHKLTAIDVNTPRDVIEHSEYEGNEDMFRMEVEDKSATESKMKLPLAHTLDVCMNQIFNYFLTQCHDENGQLHWEKTKQLYLDMIVVFDRILLPTYNTHHVQFAMFFLCTFKPTISEAFINYLWKKCVNHNVACIHRQTAAAYLASFLARSMISLPIMKGMMQQMSNWILAYIHNQDGLECVNSNVRVHAVFYSVCQALFYIIAFRHKDFISTRKNLTFLEGLSLGKIVTSRLNPLRVCQPAVLSTFAAVARTYQLAYCYSIIEHNSRNILPTIYQDDKGSLSTSNNILDDLFPFDPYLLKRSKGKITPSYLEYSGSFEEFEQPECTISEEVVNECENDDFLMDTTKHAMDRFSYGTSPGFKHKG